MNRSSSFLKRLTILLTLFAVYVLSSAPVHALYANDRLEKPIPGALVTFYKPVSWLHENTPLSVPMAAYDGWWSRTLKRS
jgi:hypothetical protein